MARLSIWMRLNTNKEGVGQLINKAAGLRRSLHSLHSLSSLRALKACCLLLPLALALSSCRPAPKPKVYIQTLPNKHYQLMVDGKPYFVKGVCYNPLPIGKNHEYDWWSDPNKPWLVDGKLMQAMGVNTVRIYKVGPNPGQVKQVIRDFYTLFGIRVILGDWLGFWEYPCPLYGSKDFQEGVKKEVLSMVATYKDEPGVLMWILGNENNYSCLGTINPWTTPEISVEQDPQKQKRMRSTIYYSYVNDIAKEVKILDPQHPVALGNGELIGLEVASSVCPDIDLVACIIYRGKTFGNLFNSLRSTFDKPILLSEFGADAYDAYLRKEDQNMQAYFLELQWRQIFANAAYVPGGAGNCLGGTMFEWSDEWWKHNEYSPAGWQEHDLESNWSNGSYYFDILAPRNMNMNEEWFGLVALSQDEEGGLDLRKPRKAYYVIREFWKNPSEQKKKESNTK